MHYGSFRLSYEPVEEPVQRLLADAERRGIEKKVCVLEEGVTRLFDQSEISPTNRVAQNVART